MITEVSLLAAFVAGILSITSPCVLPLVPIYLAHIAGVSVGTSGGQARVALMRNAAAYVLGFSLVFVALGAAFGAAGTVANALDLVVLNRTWLVRFGGVFLIVLGLYQTNLIQISFLDRARSMNLNPGTPGTVASSFIIGVSFGAGWSPCLTPILGGILMMAAGQGDVERGTLLLVLYALGLGVPFLMAAAAFGSAPGVLRKLNGRLHSVTLVSGAIMLGIGVIMVLGMYELLFTEIVGWAPWSPWEPSM
ncbi:MAG TPA: cytochrome c biogenesis protein CcdA [Thermomicrobiales bacterium]|nr:cytochrome c biogenesis protein CcdA [Thermomicrobiales bacterium]